MSKLTILTALTGVLLLPGTASARSFPTNDMWDGTYFATPSGKIVCAYGGGGIDCTNFKEGYTRGGELGQRLWGVNRTGRGFARVIVGNAPTQDLPRAQYGVTYTYRTITCRISRRSGITCRNRGNHGFTVSVERQRVF